MGYKNMQAVYDINRAGRMAIRRGDNMTLNKNAELVLMFMASQTYDWDSENNCPPKKLMDKKVPCRYYTLGCSCVIAASSRPSNLLRLVRTLGFFSYWATMRRMPQWNDGPGSALASDSAMMMVVLFDLF